MTEQRKVLTVPQFAEALGVTQACVRKWLIERRIVSTKLGRLIRIPTEEVDRLIVEGLRPAKPQRAQ